MKRNHHEHHHHDHHHRSHHRHRSHSHSRSRSRSKSYDHDYDDYRQGERDRDRDKKDRKRRPSPSPSSGSDSDDKYKRYSHQKSHHESKSKKAIHEACPGYDDGYHKSSRRLKPLPGFPMYDEWKITHRNEEPSYLLYRRDLRAFLKPVEIWEESPEEEDNDLDFMFKDDIIKENEIDSSSQSSSSSSPSSSSSSSNSSSPRKKRKKSHHKHHSKSKPKEQILDDDTKSKIADIIANLAKTSQKEEKDFVATQSSTDKKEPEKSKHRHHSRHHHHKSRKSHSKHEHKKEDEKDIKSNDNDNNDEASNIDNDGEWIEKKAEDIITDADIVGPKPLPEITIDPKKLGLSEYKANMLSGEADAMAKYVQEHKRIPRRGEIGLTADEIQKFEDAGYVMSGNRHKLMNAVRIRKENQVYTLEEKRALALMTHEQNMKKEAKIVEEFREMIKRQQKEEEELKK